MADNHSIRTHNWKLPDPAPEPEADEEAAQDAVVDVVFNLFREKNNGQSMALRISVRLPDKT
jgi:hypothetical protein